MVNLLCCSGRWQPALPGHSPWLDLTFAVHSPHSEQRGGRREPGRSFGPKNFLIREAFSHKMRGEVKWAENPGGHCRGNLGVGQGLAG